MKFLKTALAGQALEAIAKHDLPSPKDVVIGIACGAAAEVLVAEVPKAMVAVEQVLNKIDKRAGPQAAFMTNEMYWRRRELFYGIS